MYNKVLISLISIILITFGLTACSGNDESSSPVYFQSGNISAETTYQLCSTIPAGEYTTCKIPRAYCSYQSGVKGKPTFCNDAKYPNNNFTLLVWGTDWSAYDGKCLIISGLVEYYQGKTEIVATSGSNVNICK